MVVKQGNVEDENESGGEAKEEVNHHLVAGMAVEVAKELVPDKGQEEESNNPENTGEPGMAVERPARLTDLLDLITVSAVKDGTDDGENQNNGETSDEATGTQVRV
jgi:hypothetical protein